MDNQGCWSNKNVGVRNMKNNKIISKIPKFYTSIISNLEFVCGKCNKWNHLIKLEIVKSNELSNPGKQLQDSFGASILPCSKRF